MANKTPALRPVMRTDVTPLFYSIAQTGVILHNGKTRIYELIAAGELVAVKDGRSSKITAESVHRRAQKLIENSAKVVRPDAMAPAA